MHCFYNIAHDQPNYNIYLIKYNYKYIYPGTQLLKLLLYCSILCILF